MATGKVKRFNPQKGYGFIRPSVGGRYVFVHMTAVRAAGVNTLTEGHIVSGGKESWLCWDRTIRGLVGIGEGEVVQH